MILLLGDYSSVHYELSKALKESGKDVILMSDGDAYKKVKCDIQLPGITASKYKIINRILFVFRFFGFFGLANYFKVKKEIEKIDNINIIQIINPVVIPSLGALGNVLLIRYLRRRTPVLSLCALGDDYHWVKACLDKKFKYSPMDRLFQDGAKRLIEYSYMLKYVYSPFYRFLDYYALKKIDMVIPGLLDYKIAYTGNKKVVDIIKLPVAESNFTEPTKTQYPVKIFHAWQAGKENRKGNDVLHQTVQRYIEEHGSDKIHYEVISNLTYDEYLKKYKYSDVIFDQIYSYDCGVTGALGMASGKLVFSGFEERNFICGINATPNKEQLYSDFCKIINSLDEIDRIKKNAYDYAKSHYDSRLVCDNYLSVWSYK